MPAHCEFRAASGEGPERFFAKQRVPRQSPIKSVKHDVPAIVVPTRHQQHALNSKTPRREMLTLPPVRPAPRSLPQIDGPARFLGSVTPRGGAKGDAPVATYPQTARSDPVSLPQLTFSTNAPTGLSGSEVATKAALSARFRSRLHDYVDDDEDDSSRHCAAERQRQELNKFEARHVTPRLTKGSTSNDGPAPSTDHHTVTTIDEEASTRVLKVMFQLNLTRNSSIIARLKELDHEYLHRKVMHELGYKKQMSRDEFFALMCKVLKDDFINKRDCMTLFSVFDDDKSGLVDAVEFVTGFLTLIAAGENDIAFKFIHTVLDSRGEKAIMNAFISRFEVQLLVGAAQHHFAGDRDIVGLLEGLPNSFNFSHHLGRIPIVQFRDRIMKDEDLSAIFSALPNPSRPAKEAAAVAVADARDGRAKGERSVTIQESPAHGRDGEPHGSYQHILADQYMSQNQDLQMQAEEHDSPRWWVSGGIVYKASDSNPYPEPVFLKENDKRR
uniref:EF-hand domain-containing protein n=1 Tax=Neobodo designis TaxID=312471 RepID=A0A7S1M695_NEODS